MKSEWFAAVAVVSIGCLAPVIVHCSSTAPAAPPPADDGGAEAGAAGFTYQPTGCPYAVSVPATRPFTDFALDDATAPGDPASAAPQRVRLGLGGNTTKGGAGYADPTTSAVITLETAATTTNAKVRLGTADGAFTQTFTGYSFTSPPPESGLGFSQPPARMHEVHVCGLAPATTYYYQVGGGAAGSEVWSATQSFTTVPASGKITVGVFGDSRDSVTTWQMVHARMRDAAVSLSLNSGDVVDFGTEESLFDQWLDAVWKDPNDASKFLTLGQIMMIPVAGNHEEEASQFYANFAVPGSGDQAEQYASFDVGNTHFVLLDDTPISAGDPAGDAILAWLDADLAAARADRAAHPFIVTVCHRSLFGTSTHADDPDVLAARGALAPVFDKYHVDLAMTGHSHEYERSKPLVAGSPASGSPVVKTTPADGTIYVVNAGAGADAYAIETYAADYREGHATAFGKYSTQGYVGVYALLALEGGKLTMTAYGMKSSSTSVAGDDVIDTLTLGQ